jgi:hypothetical protein
VVGFAPLQHRHREYLLVDPLVLVESEHRLVPGTLAVVVCGVALLPEKLLRAKKRFGLGGLPPHDRTPLVETHRQVAV